MHISETGWAYPHRVGGNPGDFGVCFFDVAPAPFCVGSLLSLLAKRKSGREICVSSLLFGFCLSFFSTDQPRFLKPKCFILFAHYFTLLSLSGPSLRARSAATEEKKSCLELRFDWGFVHMKTQQIEGVVKWLSPIECAAQTYFQSMPGVCTYENTAHRRCHQKSVHSSVK